jgi:hypothetical protein
LGVTGVTAERGDTVGEGAAMAVLRGLQKRVVLMKEEEERREVEQARRGAEERRREEKARLQQVSIIIV